MTKDFKDPQATIEFVEALKRRWMATVDAIVDPLMIIKKDYNILQANQALASHSKIDVKELVGKKCYDVFAGRNSPCPGCQLNQSLNEQKALNFELEEVLDERYYEVTSQPIFDSKENIEGALHIYRDRTHARQLQNQLMQSEKLASIGLLAGGVAHEINNPLGGILIFSQMMLREMDKKNPHYEDVKEIEAATQRCKSIVESLLDFARQQPNMSQDDKLEDVDLRDSLKSALKFGSVGGATNHIEVHDSWENRPYLVKGNRNKTIQVLLNLIQNAVHAMPDGGHLYLSLREEMQQNVKFVVAEVKDTGIGITPQDIQKIFDPFFTSKAEGQGTGLGLSICHGIAEDMGGTIEVESQVNQGSKFRFIVPALKLEAKSA
ncbi:MAG: two-component system sensor histidine kinase NtrB [Oligoflexus sp.]